MSLKLFLWILKPFRSVGRNMCKLNFLLLFVILFSISSKAEIVCEHYLSESQESSNLITAAIKNGLSIYDTHSNPYEPLQDVYIHATSISTVTGINGLNWYGNSITGYEALHDFSSFYPNSNVTHAFFKPTTSMKASNLFQSKDYAQMSARRAYISDELKIPRNLFKEPFVFEILEYIDDKEFVIEILSETKLFDTTHALLKLRQMSELEWSLFLDKFYSLKGVLLVIDGKIENTLPVETDPEHQEQNAVIIISQDGLPVSMIKAIIPLSRIERNELQKLINK